MSKISLNYNDLHNFLIEFCRVKSVVGTSGENLAAKFMYDELAKLDYFKNNPDNIWLDKLEDDNMGRHNFCGLIKADTKTDKTVVLLGHIDVVNTDVCGEYAELAFDPIEYTKIMTTIDIDDEAKRDLQTGDWLFGRGVSDMKSGLTVLTGIFAEMSKQTDKLNCNYLLLGLADEENNGFGIHQAVKTMARMKHEHGYDFICGIDAEPNISSEHKDSPTIYLGTIGCATPFALCIGKESHVGEYFEGVNSTLIASHFNILAEGSDEMSDEWKSVHYSPQTCLKMQELRDGYSVTLPERSIVCYNVLMVSKTASEILGYFTKTAKQALENTLLQVKARRQKLFDKGSTALPEIDYDIKVLQYSDLLSLVEKATGRSHIEVAKEILADLDINADSQDRSIALINKFADIADIEGLTIVVGLLSPYCQSRVNKRTTPREIAMIDAVSELEKEFEATHNEKMVISEIFEGISDMSEFGLQDSEAELNIVETNLVGYKTDIHTPFDAMKEFDVPVINIGTIGRDAHKMTERVYLPYAFNVLPNNIISFIDKYIKRI